MKTEDKEIEEKTAEKMSQREKMKHQLRVTKDSDIFIEGTVVCFGKRV